MESVRFNFNIKIVIAFFQRDLSAIDFPFCVEDMTYDILIYEI